MGCGMSSARQTFSCRNNPEDSKDALVLEATASRTSTDPARRAKEDLHMTEELTSDLQLVPEDDPRVPSSDDFAIGSAASGQIL